MANPMSWKLLTALLAMMIVRSTKGGGIQHSAAQVVNSTLPEHSPLVISKRETTYKMYLVTSVIIQAAKEKPLTNESLILNIDLSDIGDADDVEYFSDERSQTVGTVVKIKYVDEFERGGSPHVQRDIKAHSMSITLEYFSQSFQRSLANVYSHNVHKYRYILFSTKSLHADSFEKSGLQLEKTDIKADDVAMKNDRAETRTKNFKLEISNREIFLNSDFGKKLMQSLPQAVRGKIMSSTSEKLQNIVRFFENLTLTIHLTTWEDAQHIYATTINEMEGDFYSPFVSQYILQQLFAQLALKAKVRAVNVKNYLISCYESLSVLMRKVPSANNLVFHTGDSSSLEHFLSDFTNQLMNASVARPVAIFKTWSITYACDQITQLLYQYHLHDLYFVSFDNIALQSEFLEAALTMPGVGLPRTICLLFPHSITLPERTIFREQLEVLKKFINQKNDANVRVIFVVEECAAGDNGSSKNLLTILNETFFANSSGRSGYIIEDGPYKLRKSSLNTALNISIQLNGRITTIRELFSPISPASHELSLGKHVWFHNEEEELTITGEITAPDTLISGNVYIQRQLPPWPINDDMPLAITPDTPTAIANSIVRCSKPSLNSKVIAINGKRGSGKTVILQKIQYEVQTMSSSIWSIFIDLPNFFPPSRSGEYLSVEKIVQEVVDPRFHDLFWNLLRVNPRKIVFLLDGVSEMTSVRETDILNIVGQLFEMGVHVVLTGSFRTMELLLNRPSLAINIYDIREMSSKEKQKVLINLWHEKLINETLRDSTEMTNHLDGYVHEFFEKLHDSVQYTITPLVLVMIAEIFRKHCSAYLQNKFAEFDLPTEAFDQVSRKTDLYEKYVDSISESFRNVRNFHRVYSIRAFVQIFESVESHNRQSPLLSPIITEIVDAQQQYQTLVTLDSPGPCTSRDYAPSIINHLDIKEFFASKYAEILFSKTGVDTPIDLLESLMVNPAYNGILQYLDLKINTIVEFPILFETFESTNDKTTKLRLALKNVIDAGFENLHRFIYNTLTPAQLMIIKDFYRDAKIEFYQPHQTFGELELREYAQTSIFEELPKRMSCTLMCTFVKNNMLTSLQWLKKIKIWYDSDSPKYATYYNNMLDIAVTRSTPNLQMLEFLIQNPPTRGFVPDYNSLLIRAVSEIGDGCQPIADYLIELGADPKKAQTSDGRGLLHVAVKWQSLNLLKYIVEKLEVYRESTSQFGLTVFAAALDANPCPNFTPSGWWEMVNYLCTHVEGIANTHLESINLPSTSRAEAATTRLFKATLVNLYSSNLHAFSEQATLNVMTNEKLGHLIRYATWNMHPETLSLHRRLLTKQILTQNSIKKLSPLEMLLHYQSVGSMPAIDRMNYEITVSHLLRNSRSDNNRPRTKLMRMLSANLYNTNDLESLAYFLDQGIKLTPAESEMMMSLLDQRMSSPIPLITSPMIEPSTSTSATMDVILKNRPTFSAIASDASAKAKYSRLIHALMKSASRPNENTVLAVRRTIIEQCSTQPLSSSCTFDWNLVRQFISMSDDGRSIRINSGRLLTALTTVQYTDNLLTEQQLMRFGRFLMNLAEGRELLLGNSRLTLREIFHYPDLNSYRSNQVISRITNDIFSASTHAASLESEANLRFSTSNHEVHDTLTYVDSEHVATVKTSSYSTVGHAMSVVMFIRHLHAAVAMCATVIVNNEDAKECITSSSSLAKFTLVDFIGPQLAGYMPLVIMYYSHSIVNHLPTNMRHFFTPCFESGGLCTPIHTRKMIKYGLGTVGALFDIYMIADFTKSLFECIETASCTPRTMTDLVVSLSFTSVSLGVTITSMIIEGGELTYPLLGFGLLILESVILTGNTIRWYSSEYHTNFVENVRICLYSFLFMGIPKDVLALQARTDRINDQQKQIVEFLKKSGTQIVAYATGIGRLSKSVWIPGKSIINMADRDLNNTQGLSRILPKSFFNILPLCLPQRDPKQPYEKQLRTVGSSTYGCKNAFAIADKKRWLSRTRDSIVVFDLLHVDRGYIRGSDIANNHFIIWEGLRTLKIAANTDQVSNVFSFQHPQFRGQISLLGMPSYQTIFDMSNLQDIVLVLWSTIQQTAFIQVGSESRNNFTIVKKDSPGSYFLFNGRSNRKDIYWCDYHTNSRTNIHDRSITVNGAGGNDHPAQYDDIIDCHTSIVQPWTIIRGSISSETVYTSIVYMDHPPITNQSLSIAKIVPKKSQFRVIFSDSQFILEKTIQVTYSTKNETLIWHFRHTNKTEMKLHIESFAVVNPINQTQNMRHEMSLKSQTVFFDHYSNATIYPVIKFSENQTNIEITFFHLIVSITTAKFSEIYSYYHQKLSIKTTIQVFSFDVTFVHEKTSENYIFGSDCDGRYLIEANTILVAGNGGKDVYVYSRESPRTVYIDNYSSDRIIDTLIIVNETCSTLDSVNQKQLGSSVGDLGNYLLLQCSSSRGTATTVKYIVVLKYFDRLEWRHLQILWNNKVFVPLPPNWNDRHSIVLDSRWSPSITQLALYFSFDESWNGTSLRPTLDDSLIMVNEGIITNPLLVYRIGNDVMITKKFFNDGQDASFLILEHFFINENHTRITPRYRHTNFRLIFVNDESDNPNAKIWRVEDIVLQLNLEVNDITNPVEDLIHNTYVNMNNTSLKPAELFCNFNNKSTHFSSDRIHVLTLYGVKASDFRIDFYNKDAESNSSLAFYAKNNTVVIQDWCKSTSNRPKYIAFLTGLETEPVMIKHVDTLNCTESNTYKIIDHLENLFSRAQRRLNLLEKIGSTDSSRAIKCLGIYFAQHIDRDYIYRIFGFSSLVEQLQYIENNCNELFSENNNYIDSVTHSKMYQMLNDTFALFVLGDDLPSPHEQTIMVNILTKFRNFHEFCWVEFKNSFHANKRVTRSVIDIQNVIRWQQFRDALFEQCSRESSVREFEDTPFNSTIIAKSVYHNKSN